MMPFIISLSEFFRVYIVILLAGSLTGKINSFERFRETISEILKPAGKIISNAVALLIISAESLTALLLVTDNTIYLGMIMSSILFLLFTSVIIFTLINKIKLNCNCFGDIQENISFIDLYRNIIIVSIIIMYTINFKTNLNYNIKTDIIIFGSALIIYTLTANLKNIKNLIETN